MIMEFIQVTKTDASYSIKYLNKDKTKHEIELSREANFSFAQLTKYEFPVVDRLTQASFDELRKLGILKLDDRGRICEPVKLSVTGEALQDIFASLQFKKEGTSIDCANIKVKWD